MEKYEASNREVAKLFFGNERTSLFLDPISENETQTVFQGLTIENTVPVLMELLFSQHKTINKLSEEIEKLKLKFGDKVLSGFGSYSFIEIELKEFVRGIVSEHQISGKKLKKEGFIFESTGNDPNFTITNPLPAHKIKALSFALTAPDPTFVQIYYTGAEEPIFTEEQSVKKPLSKGKNRITLRLPKSQAVNYFRFDPGASAGKYMLHQFEIDY